VGTSVSAGVTIVRQSSRGGPLRVPHSRQ
jgi:hypothetical protein